MEQRLYIRLRGRVQGPFEKDRIRELVRSGQISQIHKLSVDQIDWRPASDFPELFPDDSAAPMVAAGASAQPPAPAQAEWYYALGDQQNGPVSLEELRRLAQSGALGPEELVWNDSMTNWEPAVNTPQLAGEFSASAAALDRGASRGAESPAGVARTLTDSRGWITCIVVGLFLIGAIFFIAGGALVMLAVKASQPLVMAAGFNIAILALVFLWAGQLTLSINSRIGRYLQQPDATRLDSFLRSLRSLWVFAAIVMIVAFVNSLVVCVWAASAGVALLPGRAGL